VSQLNFIFYFRILSDVLLQSGFALNVLPEDDGASGSSTANVLLRGETSHVSHPSMEEHAHVIGDDEHIIQIGH
jgi:hypothetical protein